jgi:hypothetical protein
MFQGVPGIDGIDEIDNMRPHPGHCQWEDHWLHRRVGEFRWRFGETEPCLAQVAHRSRRLYQGCTVDVESQ